MFSKQFKLLAALFIGSSAALTSGYAQALFGGTNAGAILRFAADGSSTTFATGLGLPTGLAFNTAGDLFVADNTNGQIVKFTPAGVKTTFASGLSSPWSLAFSAAGDLYVGTVAGISDSIYKYAPNGAVTTFATGLSYNYGLAFDSSGNLFAGNYGLGQILKYTPGGTQSVFYSGAGVQSYALAFNNSGTLFVSTATNNIFTLNPSGGISFFAGSLSAPVGLTFDPSGNLLESNLGTQSINSFTPGALKTTFATGVSIYGLAYSPAAIPEPGSTALLTAGVFALYVVYRRRR